MTTDSPSPRSRPPAAAVLVWVLSFLLLLPISLPAAPWVVITEIHYHPPAEEDQFIEVMSREPPRVDLTDWTLSGEVEYRFPAGTVLRTGESVVIARSPESFRRRRSPPGRVLGPFAGNLGNGGKLVLRNAAGALACSVHYRRGGAWPVAPDGTGFTLSLLDPHLDPGDPRNWAPSPRLGGTPCAPNFPIVETRSRFLLRKGDVARFFRGTKAPEARWREGDFPDSSWETGPTGIGYGDGDDATTISDMRGRYLSIYTRQAFPVETPEALGRLVLRIDFDDGFIAYLNGKEAARAGMGPPGKEVSFDQPAADPHEAGVPAEFDLGPAARWLRPGMNVLAIQVHNQTITSSDLSLIPELEAREGGSSPAAAHPLINEVVLGGEDPFIEIYNAGSAPARLEGAFLTDDPGALRKLRLPASPPVPPRGFAVLRPRDLGAAFPGTHAAFLALVDSAGASVLDAVRLPGHGGKAGKGAGKKKGAAKGTVRGAKTGEKASAPAETGAKGAGSKEAGAKVEPSRSRQVATPEDAGAGDGGADGDEAEKGERAEGAPAAPPRVRGRLPDGDPRMEVLASPTPGAPNAAAPSDLVVDEIMYHPITGDDDDTYVEVHNRGSREVSLEGWRLGGDISFRFPPGTIAAGGYLAVAKAPSALARKYGLAPKAITGPFTGRLRRGHGRVTLHLPAGALACRIEYADAAPWPRAADGLGSSLELRDPSLDPSLPSSWAASDERAKAKWETFGYVKEHRLFQARNFEDEFQFLLLGEGECLIDDVEVAGVFADGFDRGAAGWTAMGTHELSGPTRDEASGGKPCYRIVADGRGNARHNYVVREASNLLAPGRKYKVTFRARWQSGSPLLLTRTAGQGAAKTHRLTVPARLGTPGAENSVRKRPARPAIGVPLQEPVVPLSGEPVALEVRISSRSPVQEAAIHYRADESAPWSSVPFEREGAAAQPSALYRGKVPGLPAGVVLFYLSAKDADGNEAFFPPAGAGRPALYGVGLLPPKKFPAYTLLAPESTWQALEKRPKMSNRLLDGTLVFGTSRIFYEVGFRPRGSPFTRSPKNWRIVFGADTTDGRKALTLDSQGGDGTRLNERLTYWFVDQLHAPNSRQQYVHFRIPGREEGVYEDVEKIDRGYLERWFGGRGGSGGGNPAEEKKAAKEAKAIAKAVKGEKAGGKAAVKGAGEGTHAVHLHKIDDHWEIPLAGQPLYREADFVFAGLDPEDYRWNFPPRANSVSEDFDPLLRLVSLLDPKTTPDKSFDPAIDKAVDVDEWLRVLAARTIVDDWDTMGRTRGKNSFLFLAPDGRWRLLPWDCDLAWRDPQSPLVFDRFPSIRRFLTRPVIRRRFYAYLAYLAERKMETAYFEGILNDLHLRSGAVTEPFLAFAEARRAVVLRQIAKGPFRAQDVKRVEKPREHDVVQATGVAPTAALRFRLDGREGEARLVGADGWAAEFPVGPQGGDLVLQALDFGGNELARATVKVRPRPGAPPLPREEPVPEDLAAASGAETSDEGMKVAPGEAPPGEGHPPAPPDRGPLAPDAGRPPPAGTGQGPGTRSPTEAVARAGAGEKTPGGDDAPADSSSPSEGKKTALLPVSPSPRGSSTEPRVARRSARAKADPRPEARVAGRSAPSAPPAPPGGAVPAGSSAGETWRWVLPLALVFAGGLTAAFLFLRSRRRTSVRSLVARLGGDDFDAAEEALEALEAMGELAVPDLLAALDDVRKTRFLRLRRTTEGLAGLPSQGPSEVRVRQVAALLLDAAIGRPPVERPARRDWEAHWEAAKSGKDEGPAPPSRGAPASRPD